MDDDTFASQGEDHDHDPDQRCRSDCRQEWRMPLNFDPSRYSTIELVAIAMSVLAVAVIAFYGISIWATPA